MITNPAKTVTEALVWEARQEYHHFAPDRLSEAHVSLKNGQWEWSTFVFRKNKYHPQCIAASGSGRSVTADAAMLAAEQWLKEQATP